MRLRSLRARIVAAGVIVVALVLGGLDAFVYLSLRQQLDANVEALLDDRVQLVRSLGEEHDPELLAGRLQAAGIRAVLTLPDGTDLLAQPASGEVAAGLPPEDGSGDEPGRDRSRAVQLPGGTTATVFASIDGTEAALEHMRFLLVSGTVLGVGLAALLLLRWISGAMRPLEELIDAAHRVADGEHGVRLHPRTMMTEIGRVSLAFDEVTESLETALGEAQQANEATQAFVADAAHQLRTPITGIQAAAEVLAMDLRPEDRVRATELLVEQTTRVGALLSGLLRLAKLDLGEEPRQEMIDLVTVCRREIEHAGPRCPGVSIELRSEVETATPVELDSGAMAEVLSNLLDNACRHATRRIDVSLVAVGPNIEIRVADDGAGIEPTDADRVFDRFVSLDGGGGSGLGLPIARGLVEAHGGTLTYTDGRFVVRLMRERRQRPVPRRAVERPIDRADRRRPHPDRLPSQDPSPAVLGEEVSGSGAPDGKSGAAAGVPR